jgi:hypothetical protein
MVHALQETWRVLTAEGNMIDLRPLAGESRVEVLVGDEVLSAGLVDESGDEPDDIAANKALAHLVSEGRFILEQQAFFDYALYWDTPDEMKAYVEARWTKSRLPDEVLAKTRRLAAGHSPATKIRLRRRMIIARYRKQA